MAPEKLRLCEPSAALVIFKGAKSFEGINISRLAAHQTLQLVSATFPKEENLGSCPWKKNLSLGAYIVNSQTEVRRRVDELLETPCASVHRSKQVAEN